MGCWHDWSAQLHLSCFRNAQLYWHTLLHLKLVQIWGRVAFRLRIPKPDLRPAPGLSVANGNWQMPAARRPSMLSPSRFRFLNEEHELRVRGDWNATSLSKLWLYNLHYFDDLNAERALNRAEWHRSLIDRWVIENPPGLHTGWEPYPLSIRIVNWIKWILAGNKMNKASLDSLAAQVRFLTRRLEWHLLGNHLFANAKALVFAGCFFKGAEADSWLRLGMGILAKEISEQILSDGGHFERSTMYHAIALEDMLDLVNVAQNFASRLSSYQQQVADWPQLICTMHKWMLVMCHPDGEISLFNDAAFDIAPSVAELDAYAGRLLVDKTLNPKQLPLLHLKDSGYIRLACGPAVALLDVAPVGPDYLPGHAHADTLSFELSLGAHRVLVNSGTSCYGDSAERLRQRGTAAHNTVVVDGKDSSEVWGGFRMARRAYPVGLHIEYSADASAAKVRCAHNGYARLFGKPTHYRSWRMVAEGLTVIDQVEGPHKSAEARFYFHPTAQLETSPDQTKGTVTLTDGTVITWQLDDGQGRLQASTWHPQFGIVVPNVCLAVMLVEGRSTLHFRWAACQI